MIITRFTHLGFTGKSSLDYRFVVITHVVMLWNSHVAMITFSHLQVYQGNLCFDLKIRLADFTDLYVKTPTRDHGLQILLGTYGEGALWRLRCKHL